MSEPREFWVLPAWDKVPGDQGHCFETYQAGSTHAIEYSAYKLLQAKLKVYEEALEKIKYNLWKVQRENPDWPKEVVNDFTVGEINFCLATISQTLEQAKGMK